MSVGNGPEPEPTADQLARSLAWHGIAAEVRRIEQGSQRVRDILLSEAAAMAADLLVLGAYSHSRMRQVVFGGVTEHMLDYAELPVLMTSLGPPTPLLQIGPERILQATAGPSGPMSALEEGAEHGPWNPGIRSQLPAIPVAAGDDLQGRERAHRASTRRTSAARSPASSPRNSSRSGPSAWSSTNC